MAESLDLGKKVAGAPIGVWAVGGTAVIGGIWFYIRNKKAAAANAANAANSSTTSTTGTAPATSGDFSTDQAESIFSDIRNLQGQETNFSDTASQLNQGIAGVSGQVTGVSNQVTGVGNQVSGVANQVSNVGNEVSHIPAGPPGPPGPAGTPGAPAPQPPPPPRPQPVQAPPPPRPTQHMGVVHTDGKHSIDFYASAYGASVGNILAATAKAEPSDYNRASSLLHKYIVRGKWNYELPAGYTLYVPYIR